MSAGTPAVFEEPARGAPPEAARGTAGRARRSRAPLIVTLVMLGALLAAGVAAGVWWLEFTRSPAYSVGQIADAVRQGDWNGVQRYVDVASVVGQAVDAAVGRSAGGVVAGLAESAKPALVRQAKESLRLSVERGGTSPTQRSAAFSSYVAAVQVASVRYVGDEALVTLAVPGGAGKVLDLKLRMRRAGDHWRVTRIDDVLDLPGVLGP